MEELDHLEVSLEEEACHLSDLVEDIVVLVARRVLSDACQRVGNGGRLLDPEKDVGRVGKHPHIVGVGLGSVQVVQLRPPHHRKLQADRPWRPVAGQDAAACIHTGREGRHWCALREWVVERGVFVVTTSCHCSNG